MKVSGILKELIVVVRPSPNANLPNADFTGASFRRFILIAANFEKASLVGVGL